MNIFFGMIIGYVIIYITICFHEFGHAFCYYLFKCKKNPFMIKVKPTLYFSSPGEIDYEKVKHIAKWKYVVACYGGLIVNAILAIIFYVLTIFIKTDNFYINILVYGFLSINLAEFVSYMFIGNIYLVSDMQGVALNCPKLRWVNLLFGIVVSVYYVCLFTVIPKDVFWILLGWNILIVFCMGICRIIFTYSYSKRKA